MRYRIHIHIHDRIESRTISCIHADLHAVYMYVCVWRMLSYSPQNSADFMPMSGLLFRQERHSPQFPVMPRFRRKDASTRFGTRSGWAESRQKFYPRASKTSSLQSLLSLSFLSLSLPFPFSPLSLVHRRQDRRLTREGRRRSRSYNCRRNLADEPEQGRA